MHFTSPTSCPTLHLVSLSKPAIDVTVGGMARELVADQLWETIEPLLPPEPPKPKGGRPRVDNRAALTGIIFVLKSGIPWEMMPQEMGCGSGVTCWRRLRDWQEVGVWERLHRVFLEVPSPVGEGGGLLALLAPRRIRDSEISSTEGSMVFLLVFSSFMASSKPFKASNQGLSLVGLPSAQHSCLGA
jgi:transposase